MKHVLATGDQAPDFTYRRPDGTTESLSRLWADGAALLVWPRHCG